MFTLQAPEPLIVLILCWGVLVLLVLALLVLGDVRRWLDVRGRLRWRSRPGE